MIRFSQWSPPKFQEMNPPHDCSTYIWCSLYVSSLPDLYLLASSNIIFHLRPQTYQHIFFGNISLLLLFEMEGLSLKFWGVGIMRLILDIFSISFQIILSGKWSHWIHHYWYQSEGDRFLLESPIDSIQIDYCLRKDSWKYW